MDKEPRLLTWNYTIEENNALNHLLKEIGAPPAVPVSKNQGTLTLREIIHTGTVVDEEFISDEHVILFYNIPPKGVQFLINTFKQTSLPRPIYAVITPHSIEWPFSKLLEHLIEEREAWAVKAAAQKQEE